MTTDITKAQILVMPAYSDDFPVFVGALLQLTPDLDVAYFLARPSKWWREAELWYEHDCPTDPADDAMRAWFEACDTVMRAS